MKASVRRAIEQIARAAGAARWEVVREHRHIVLDYHFPNRRTPVRQVMSASLSDNARGLKNQIAELRRAARI